MRTLKALTATSFRRCVRASRGLAASVGLTAGRPPSQEEMDKELAKIHEEIDKLRAEHDDVFKKADKDGNGALSPDEFYAVQREDEPEANQGELEEAFADHDSDGSGGLSLEEWQAPFEDTVQNMLHAGDDEALDEEHSIEHYRQEFEQFDKNQDSFLDESELAELATAMHEHPSHAATDTDAPAISAADILAAVDRNSDGKVDFEEYVLDGQGEDDEEDDPHATDLSLEDVVGGDDHLDDTPPA